MSPDKAFPGPAARAAAAAWVARLHGPQRTPEVEAGLKRWLAESPEHIAAFELLTEIWEKSARLRRRPLEKLARWEQVGFRLRVSWAALATACTCITAVLVTRLFFVGSNELSTGIGEQRTVTLEDGTRVHLSTRTQITVRYGREARRVELTSGEALFVVSHAPRPFIVTAGGHHITALGTQFDVRRDPAALAVTLLEGKVTVTQAPATPPLTLLPGQRVRFAAGEARFDSPSLATVTAWERGEVVFDDTALAEAATEMNRYSRIPLRIAGPQVAAIRVSGIFQAGDTDSFAQALAATYHLRVRHQAGTITLEADSPPSR